MSSLKVPEKGEAYICRACGGIFISEKSRSDSITDSEIMLGREVNSNMSVVCGECFKVLYPIMKRLGVI